MPDLADRLKALELVDRIKRMGIRWGYSPDEVKYALEAARKDPDGWRRLVESDEDIGRVSRRAIIEPEHRGNLDILPALKSGDS